MKPDELADEFRLISLAVSASLGFCKDEVIDFSPFQVDWPLVVRASRAHRSVAFVQKSLASSPAVPAEVKDQLLRLARNNAVACLERVRETTRLCKLMAAAGIRTLVIKGVVLSQQLYGDPSRRGAGDIDLLVDAARFWDADETLRASGYVPVGPWPATASARAAMGTIIRDVSYRSPNGIVVELHQRLTLNAHRLALDFEDLWEQRAEVLMAGVSFATLPLRILPLYLCVHGAHHCWERLCWLADMAVLLGEDGAAAAALADAEQVGLGDAMRLVLTLSHLVLAKPMPFPNGQDRRRGERFIHHFFTGPAGLGPVERGSWIWFRREIRRRVFLYSLKRSWAHRWQEFLGDLNNPIDLPLLPLPSRLMFLYPWLRPLGWILRNFRQSKSVRHRKSGR